MKWNKKTVASRLGAGKDSTETIGSLMKDCQELAQQIGSEKDRLERFMLETGGASDASDRIQKNISRLEGMLSAAEGRLQALFNEQEKEAFPPEKKGMDKQNASGRKESVIKALAEKKAEAAMAKSPMKKQERNFPHMDTGR